MKCKNCRKTINHGDKFCMYCGSEIKTRDILRDAFIPLVVSLIIFLIILLITVFSMIEFYKDDSGASPLIIFISAIFSWIPLNISVALSCTSSSSIKKYKKGGFSIPKRIKNLEIVNKFQIPSIILVLVIGFILKENKYNKFIDQKLDELYNSSYKVINQCKVSNETGDNYEILMLKLENFNYPIISYFDWENDNYKDNYEELKQAEKLNYRSYVNSIFGEEIISLMDFSHDDRYSNKKVYLNILLPTDYLKNLNILKSKIEQITSKYTTQFLDYDFYFDIYFLEKIDKELLDDYYIFMSKINDYSCKQEFRKKINFSVIRTEINLKIDEGENIDAAINDGFRNMHK